VRPGFARPNRAAGVYVAQVKPLEPHPPGPFRAEDPPPEPPPREAVRTVTEVKLRSTRPEPHAGHPGRFPAEYSDMDIRVSKTCPHSKQAKSYAGTGVSALLGLGSSSPAGKSMKAAPEVQVP